MPFRHPVLFIQLSFSHTLLAPRKRGREPRTGAVMLARIVVGLAVTRDGF